MKTIQTTSILALLSMMSLTAVAAETRNYRGEQCVQNWTQAEPDIYYGHGARNLNATSQRWFTCPATRVLPNGSPSGGWVMVQDRNSRRNLTCYLQSSNISVSPSWGYISIASSAGASETPQKLTFGSIGSFVDGVYSVYCSVPEAPGGDLGQSSSIIGYSVTEN